MSDLRDQLVPGWSPVTIVLVVVGFLIAWPIGVLMLGYIVFGNQLNINLAEPHTLKAFCKRISLAWQAAVASWKSTATVKQYSGHTEADFSSRNTSANQPGNTGTPNRE